MQHHPDLNRDGAKGRANVNYLFINQLKFNSPLQNWMIGEKSDLCPLPPPTSSLECHRLHIVTCYNIDSNDDNNSIVCLHRWQCLHFQSGASSRWVGRHKRGAHYGCCSMPVMNRLIHDKLTAGRGIVCARHLPLSCQYPDRLSQTGVLVLICLRWEEWVVCALKCQLIVIIWSDLERDNKNLKKTHNTVGKPIWTVNLTFCWNVCILRGIR